MIKTDHWLESNNTLSSYIKLLKGSQQEINYQEADAEAAGYYPRHKTSAGEYKRLGLFSPLHEFRSLGPSTYFLFYVLRYFTYVFFALGVLAIIPAVVYSRGGDLEAKPAAGKLAYTTIANVGQPFYQSVRESEAGRLDSPQDIDKAYRAANASANDQLQVSLLSHCIIIAGYIASLFVLKYKVAKEKALVKIACPTLSKFSLRLSNFPRKAFSRADVTTIISRFYFGQVVDISFAYQFNNSLKHLIRLAEAKIELDALYTSSNVCAEQLGRIKEKEEWAARQQNLVEAKLKVPNFDIKDAGKSLDKLEAFVVFDSVDAPESILSVYNNVKGGRRSDLAIFANQKISIDSPDDPLDLNFVNSERAFWKKLAITSLAVGLCLVLIAACLLLTGLIERNKGLMIPDYACPSIPSLNELRAVPFNSPSYQQAYSCLCQAAYAELLVLDDPSICQEYLQHSRDFYGTSIGALALIILFDMVIALVLAQALKRSRFYSKSNKSLAFIALALILIYLNTITSMAVSSQHIYGSSSIRDLYNRPYHILSTALLRVFDPDIYEKFAYRAFSLAVGLALVPQAFLLPVYKIARVMRDSHAKHAQTLKQYSKDRLPIKFDPALHFVAFLSLIFCSLTLAPGIPLIIILCFAGLLAYYWTLKYTFVTYARRAHFLKPVVVDLVIELLSLSAILFLIVAIGVHGVFFKPLVMPGPTGLQSVLRGFNQLPVFEDESISAVLFKKCLPLTVILLSFIALKIVEYVLYSRFGRNRSQRIIQGAAGEKVYYQAYEDLLRYSAANYELASLPKLASLQFYSPPSKEFCEINVTQSYFPMDAYESNDLEQGKALALPFMKVVKDPLTIHPDGDGKAKCIKKLATIKEESEIFNDDISRINEPGDTEASEKLNYGMEANPLYHSSVQLQSDQRDDTKNGTLSLSKSSI